MIFRDYGAFGVLLAGTLVRIIIGSIIPPGFDEAYYGVYSFHLDWGYYDHPPAVAVMAGIGHWLTGSYSFLSLRIGAIIAFIASNVVLYQLISELSGERPARMGVMLMQVTPMFFLGMGAVVLPDISLGLFWLLFIYFLHRLNKSGDSRWLIAAGITAGLAFLSKYHAVLLLAASFWNLLFLQKWRGLWKSPYLYLSFVVFLIVISPNLLWNYRHEWLSFTYQFGKSVSGIDISLIKFARNAFGPVGYLLPWNFYVLAVGSFKIMSTKNNQLLWLSSFVLIPVAVFLLIGFTRDLLPHWFLPGYLTSVIFGACWMSRWKNVTIKRFLIPAGIFVFLGLAVISLQAIYGFLPIDRKADITLDGHGWRDVIERLESRGILTGDMFLIGHKWFTAGEIAYAARGKYPTAVFDMPSAHSFSLWVDTGQLIGRDGLFITTERYPLEDIGRYYDDYFLRIERLPDIKTYRSGELMKNMRMLDVPEPANPWRARVAGFVPPDLSRDTKHVKSKDYAHLPSFALQPSMPSVEYMYYIGLFQETRGREAQVFHVWRCTNLLREYP